MKLFAFMLFWSLLAFVLPQNLNEKPIIGVLTQEIPAHYLFHFPAFSNYFAASYVKAVESSAARVVPIVVNKPESYYRELLNSVNGLVLPGGGAKNGLGYPYYESIRTVYKIAKELNDNGHYLPILAVCLGYEFLITAANNDKNILKNCSVFYEMLPLKFTESPSKFNLYSRLNPDQTHTLQYRNSTMNWHIWCAYVDDFTNSELSKEWKITSTSTSQKNVEFIASVEHVKYPFWGIQFHPEKIAFEWETDDIDHSEDVLQANRYFYDHLVHHAKKNAHKFLDKKVENNNVIYNHFPRYTGDITSFEQMYLF